MRICLPLMICLLSLPVLASWKSPQASHCRGKDELCVLEHDAETSKKIGLIYGAWHANIRPAVTDRAIRASAENCINTEIVSQAPISSATNKFCYADSSGTSCAGNIEVNRKVCAPDFARFFHDLSAYRNGTAKAHVSHRPPVTPEVLFVPDFYSSIGSARNATSELLEPKFYCYWDEVGCDSVDTLVGCWDADTIVISHVGGLLP
jgi:hypothetical protein